MMKPSFIFLNDDVSNNQVFNKESTFGVVKRPTIEIVYFYIYNFMQQNGTKITWQIFCVYEFLLILRVRIESRCTNIET